jgi:hypothetical protein
VALEQVLYKFFSFPMLIIIPLFHHTHLSLPHEVCNSPDQAAQYRTLGPKLGASSLAWHLAGLLCKCSFLNVNEASENKSEVLQTGRRKCKEDWYKELIWLTFNHSPDIASCEACLVPSSTDQNSKIVEDFTATQMNHQHWNLNLQRLWISGTSVPKLQDMYMTKSEIRKSGIKCWHFMCCFISECYFVCHKCARISYYCL